MESKKDLSPRTPGPSDGGCSCCGPTSDVQIQMLQVDGDQVGIIGLRQIMAEVKALGLADEAEVKKEFLERVKRRNYVVPGCDEAYRKALWQEYRRSQ